MVVKKEEDFFLKNQVNIEWMGIHMKLFKGYAMDIFFRGRSLLLAWIVSHSHCMTSPSSILFYKLSRFIN